MKWIFLLVAILFESIATTALKYSNGFTEWKPTLIMIIGYLFSFYFLALTLKDIPMGIAYAIWSAVGIILISGIGYFKFQQNLDLPAIIGISLIVIGVLVIQIFSKTTSV
ncbi:MAG: DMT family transporter [Psychroflexus halocasei]